MVAYNRLLLKCSVLLCVCIETMKRYQTIPVIVSLPHCIHTIPLFAYPQDLHVNKVVVPTHHALDGRNASYTFAAIVVPAATNIVGAMCNVHFSTIAKDEKKLSVFIRNRFGLCFYDSQLNSFGVGFSSPKIKPSSQKHLMQRC